MIIGVAVLAIMLFVSMQVYSGEGCTAKAEKAQTTATATTVTAANLTAAECAAKCGITPEECAKLCGTKENCGFTEMDIKGMTCGGCENAVTTALEAVPGVIKVVKVDHKEGLALVCADLQKCTTDDLTKAVSSKGFEASVVPAVAVSTTTVTAKKGCTPGCAKTCGAAAAKSCNKTKASCGSAKKADTETKTTDDSSL
jgi:copper chaperone CopZ